MSSSSSVVHDIEDVRSCCRRRGPLLPPPSSSSSSSPRCCPVSSSPCNGEAVRTYDVIIIGAGVIGCSVARELSRYFVSVLVLDKADDVSQGASKANSGIVHGGYDERHGTLKSRVAHAGSRRFRQLDSELHFGYKEIGSLVVCSDEADVPKLEALKRNGEANGVKCLRLLNQQQVRQLEPQINPDVVAALYCPESGITSPYEYCIALAENAIANGVHLLLRHEVEDIQLASGNGNGSGSGSGGGDDGGGFTVHTQNGSVFSAAFVVNCAGLASANVAAMIGAQNFSVYPKKGEYIILDRSQGHLARHVIFPLPTKLGKGILVSPTYFGNLLLGPTSRGPNDPVLTDLEVVRFIIDTARRSMPSFDASRALTSYSGLRAKCDRGDFIVEESDTVRGFVNCCGIDSPGLTSSPAVALLVMQLLEQSGLVLAPDASFTPYRAPIIQPKPPSWRGTLDHVDPALRIVCRCEKVTEAEIVDSMNRGIDVITTQQVKYRTRAGMGPCQGRFCQEKVAKIISRHKRIPLHQVQRRTRTSSLLPHRHLTLDDRDVLSKL